MRMEGQVFKGTRRRDKKTVLDNHISRKRDRTWGGETRLYQQKTGNTTEQHRTTNNRIDHFMGPDTYSEYKTLLHSGPRNETASPQCILTLAPHSVQNKLQNSPNNLHISPWSHSYIYPSTTSTSPLHHKTPRIGCPPGEVAFLS